VAVDDDPICKPKSREIANSSAAEKSPRHKRLTDLVDIATRPSVTKIKVVGERIG
jgi:hypothetical protein